MITNIKTLNRILILINIGFPLIYFFLFIKFNTPISYVISLIYVLLPILFIVKYKIDEQEILKYNKQIKKILNNQIFFTTTLIISVILIKFIGKTVSHQNYGAGFLIMFILLINFITWALYLNKLCAFANILNPEIENHIDDGKGEIT
jgi:uncharacterized paraquat-inducible protein A